jgi:hypothetical protein
MFGLGPMEIILILAIVGIPALLVGVLVIAFSARRRGPTDPGNEDK